MLKLQYWESNKDNANNQEVAIAIHLNSLRDLCLGAYLEETLVFSCSRSKVCKTVSPTLTAENQLTDKNAAHKKYKEWAGF